MMKQISYSPWLHRIALITAGATFLLIVIGGIVTSTESGLAVPDWPTTFGYNMFLYPLSEMVGGILYEHSHRLMGSLVGMLTIVLLVMLFVKETRKWVIWLGIAALIGVSVQGILGGLRVTELNLNFAILHACLAQAFFALLCGICLFTSSDWIENQHQSDTNVDNVSAKKLRRLALITTCLLYIQLIFGAILRHTGNRLELNLLLVILIAMHILFALMIALHIFLFMRRFLTMGEDSLGIGLKLPLILFGLLLVQLLLGFGAYITKLTAFGESISALLTDIVTTSHVVVGALMLVSSFALTLKLYKFTKETITENIPVNTTLVTE